MVRRSHAGPSHADDRGANENYSCFHSLLLKHDLQTELKLPGRCHRPRDLSDRCDQGIVSRVNNPRCRVREIGPVKEVEEISAKFQVRVFFDRDGLSQAGIEVYSSRSNQDTSTRCTVKPGRRNGKNAGIKPKRWCTELLRRHTIGSARSVRPGDSIHKSATRCRPGGEAREAAVATNPIRFP